MIGSFTRRALTATVLAAGAAMLQGCVYNPYTGTYDPCCAYPAYSSGYPAYSYPDYSYPAYGYSYPAYSGPAYSGGVVVGGGWGGGYYRGGYGDGYRGGWGGNGGWHTSDH